MNPRFVISNSICKFSTEFEKKKFNNCLAVCTRTRFWSSVNVCGIQKSFVLSKYSSKWNAHAIVICHERWQCHELCIVYLSSVSIIPLTIALHVSVTGQPEFAASLTDCLIKYLIISIHFPLFSKICITERPSFVYIGPNFLNLLNPFPKQNGSFEITIKLELYRAEGPCV